ncbi:MAG: ATP-binding protein [Candidatus Kerfeldbacteria bacterium]|nr:ATP-binding protein [Candidatus Kerfeldbacteria bacterium]
MIPRHITTELLEKITNFHKVVVLYGPRQVGKTTLCHEIIEKLHLPTLSISADESRYIHVLSSRNSQRMRQLIGENKLLFIDEAQRIPDIGINLKILIDQFVDLKIIATGSSSFELANSISEPLTGRKWTFHLYPISQQELLPLMTPFEIKEQLEERLIWGSYPGIFEFSSAALKEKYLYELEADYLYKDLLSFLDIRGAQRIKDLLSLLAFQIGKEVSIHELGTQLGMHNDMVLRYLDLLEKTFLIFHLGGFSRNLRKEISKKKKYYFYDLGIRNLVIGRFAPLSQREDHGDLWENFCIVERMKYLAYNQQYATSYFWRLYSGAEIDYVEERNGALYGYEFKWSQRKKPKTPRTWKAEYPTATYTVVNPDNYLSFVTDSDVDADIS